MSANNKKLVAVIGATGQQGGGVVRGLQASGQFKVRALSRNPGKHRDLANEVVEADLNRPDTPVRSSTRLIDRVTTFPSRRSRPTSSPLSFLELRRSPRCSGTSKRIPTWVRSHATELRSQTKYQADNQRSCRRGLD